jgi:hypothetical protein
MATVREAAGTGKSIHRADVASSGGEAAWRAGAPSPGTTPPGLSGTTTKTATR